MVKNESDTFDKMKAKRPTVDRSCEDPVSNAVWCWTYLCGGFLKWKGVTSVIKMTPEYVGDTQSRALIVYTIFCQTSNIDQRSCAAPD